MTKYTVLYNPYSGNHHGEKYAKELDNILINDELSYYSLLDIDNIKQFLKDKKNPIIVCGGDGTLNCFANKIKDIKLKNTVLYFDTGTGNDFHNDIGNKVKIPYEINRYLEDLPRVKFNDKEYVFINNASMGIDGYCCDEGNRQKERTGKPVNYTKCALKGLLYGYKPINAKITVDGKEYKFKKVYLAATMHGRYFGGGMKVAPNQDRLNKDHILTLVVAFNCTRTSALINFSAVFNGDYENKKMVKVLTGKNIKVEFEKACIAEMDGEVIHDIITYEVKAK